MQSLQQSQETNAKRAEYIELNIPLVDKAIQVGQHIAPTPPICPSSALSSCVGDAWTRMAPLRKPSAPIYWLASALRPLPRALDVAPLAKVINSALASSMEWKAIEDYVAEARAKGDAVASAISGLKLGQNKITMKLSALCVGAILLAVHGIGQPHPLYTHAHTYIGARARTLFLSRSLSPACSLALPMIECSSAFAVRPKMGLSQVRG